MNIEVPLDPHTLARMLDQHPDESDELDDEPVPTLPPSWVGGRTMVPKTIIVHGRPHVVHVARIVSSRPVPHTNHPAH